MNTLWSFSKERTELREGHHVSGKLKDNMEVLG